MLDIICIDTTILVNFKEEEKFFFMFLEKLSEKTKVAYREEVERLGLQKLSDNLTLIDEESVSFEEFLKIKTSFPQLDDGETCLIAYAVEKKGCFMSDDKKARKVGKRKNIFPCCLKKLEVGGTLGILRFLVKCGKIDCKEAKSCCERIKQRGNYLPSCSLLG